MKIFKRYLYTHTHTHTHAHTQTHTLHLSLFYLFNATYVPSFVLDSGEPVENKTSKSPIIHVAL